MHNASLFFRLIGWQNCLLHIYTHTANTTGENRLVLNPVGSGCCPAILHCPSLLSWMTSSCFHFSKHLKLSSQPHLVDDFSSHLYQKRPPTNSQQQTDQPSRVNPHTSLVPITMHERPGLPSKTTPRELALDAVPAHFSKRLFCDCPCLLHSVLSAGKMLPYCQSSRQNKANPSLDPLHPPPEIILFLCTPLQQNSP